MRAGLSLDQVQVIVSWVSCRDIEAEWDWVYRKILQDVVSQVSEVWIEAQVRHTDWLIKPYRIGIGRIGFRDVSQLMEFKLRLPPEIFVEDHAIVYRSDISDLSDPESSWFHELSHLTNYYPWGLPDE